MLENILARYPQTFRRMSLPKEVIHEAKRRIVDAVGCFYGAFRDKPVERLRHAMLDHQVGSASVWGTLQKASPEIAALVNGAGVRALDFNDTYLSKEPCHPSDMLSTLWAASEISGSKQPGKDCLRGLVLSYEVLCRLCDAASLRLRGWDHVSYLPIATAVGCSYILKLNETQTGHAVALAAVGNNALRQTRVGMISDWKAACAAYAARAGLTAARLARRGFTGPSEIFVGRHGLAHQMSGPLDYSRKPLGKSWKIMETHTKYFPAEHHAQSAIEAALILRRSLGRVAIKKIEILSFKAAVDIIGSEREKWLPTTRETADHSMPYLVVAALLDGKVTLDQFRRKRYLDSDVRRLLSQTRVLESKKYTRIYPQFLPNAVRIHLLKGEVLEKEVLLPKGYAGRAMSDGEIQDKFMGLCTKALSLSKAQNLVRSLMSLERVGHLPKI